MAKNTVGMEVKPILLALLSMAIRVVEFSNGGYKIRKVFA
jgi:hypothetical protein